MMPRHTKRQAFSLIEIAIVLGVIAVVIGGIWGVAATVLDNQKLSRTIAAMQQMVTSGQQLYTRTAATALANSTETSISSAAIAAGIIPKDFVSNGAMKDLWGNSMSFTIAGGGYCCQIMIRFATISKDHCEKLILAATRNITKTGSYNIERDLMYIDADSAGFSTLYTFPIAVGATGCQEPTLGLKFHYGLIIN